MHKQRMFLVCVCYTMPPQVTSKMSILVTVRIKRIFFTTRVEGQNVSINPRFRFLWKHLKTRAISISYLLLELHFFVRIWPICRISFQKLQSSQYTTSWKNAVILRNRVNSSAPLPTIEK